MVTRILKTRYDRIEPYITKDGSMIRELMHPTVHGNTNQSLAEAVVPAGEETVLHAHQATEEIYHITAGCGEMTVGEAFFEIVAGDTIQIPPGEPHRVRNSGNNPLRFFCCCSPSYSHEDTLLIGEAKKRSPQGP